MSGCDFCKHPLFAGLRCPECGKDWLPQPIPESMTGDMLVAWEMWRESIEREPMAFTKREVALLRSAFKCAWLASRLALPIDTRRFERAPCYICGYNGPGYFQPGTHQCAAKYHEAKR